MAGAPTALAATDTAAVSAAAATDSTAQGAQTIRALITGEHYAEAERMARARVDSLDASSPRDSLALGEAMTLLVEALWRSGRWAPRCRALYWGSS